MSGVRSVQVPFEHVTAELAAIPLSSRVALESSLVDLSPMMSGATRPLWRNAESTLVHQFPSYSIDELVAVRDWLWFYGRTRSDRTAGASQRGRALDGGPPPVPLDEYVRRVAVETLEFQGNVFRPRVPPWVDESSRTLAGSPDARARRFWRWVAFALPRDLLMAAHPDAQTRTARIDLISPLLGKLLADDGYVEAHMHIGAAIEFPVLWVALLHALGNTEAIDDESFESPGADDDEGRDLAHWLVRAAISRYVTAAFLAAWRRRRSLRFDRYLIDWIRPLSGRPVGGSTGPSGEDGHQQSGGFGFPGLGYRVWSAIRELALGQIVNRRFRSLQRTYAELTGVLRRWPKFPSDVPAGMEADPIRGLVARRPGTEGSSEMDWIATALEYFQFVRKEGRGLDEPFERAFWQTVRVRCRFYRYLVQRPMTPGLQWFVRFYGRIWAARKGVPADLLVDSAARICGRGDGLRSLEFRTSPHSTSEGTVDLVRKMLKASRRVQSHGPAHQGVVPAVELEVGVVFHLARDRGGDAGKGLPIANAENSAADPSAATNLGYRYAGYFRMKRAEAASLARLLVRYPRTLHFVRGIDLCADELGVPTWVMAPMIRYVRDVAQAASRTLGSRPSEPTPPPLRVSVHAGEDFVHLLGGIRRIDEAIDYLHLSQGDRLGHAIALGVDPHEWATNSGGLAITKMERLLDLAWEWSFSSSHDVDMPASRVQYIMDQIERLSRDVFKQFAHPRQVADFTNLLRSEAELRGVGFPGGPTPDHATFLAQVRMDVADARGFEDRRRRRGEPSRGRRVRSTAEVERHALRGSDGQRGEPKEPTYRQAEEAWGLLFNYLTDRGTFERGQEQELVDPAFEASALAVVQNALRKKVGSSGITVEINPSSNLLIGNLSDLQRHPLWRLRPPQESDAVRPIAVCIGSDNPLTFSTSTREEYQLVYDTLTLAGLSDLDARNWIESARKSGLESRFTLPAWGTIEDIFHRIDVDIDHIEPML
jgi:hypothetical protein